MVTTRSQSRRMPVVGNNDPINDTDDMAEDNSEATNSDINMSEDEEAPVLDIHSYDEVPRVTAPMEMDEPKILDVIAYRMEEAQIHEEATQEFGIKMEDIEIKEEGEVYVKRARADVLKQSRLAPSRSSSPPPDATVGNYLQDLVSFLRKLNLRNEKLNEFIEIMEDIKISYFDIMYSAKRLFNCFKYNADIFEINTGEILCCYDKTYYFELKDILVSFKKFVSNYDTILEGFGQLQQDIEDDIQRCEEEEQRGKQKLLKIDGIIDHVASDFDMFGLMRVYKAEIQKRREGNGSCCSNDY